MSDKDDKKEDGTDANIGKLFFKSRSVLITGGIDDDSARKAVTHLLALAEESDDPINVYISSPGGHVESGRDVCLVWMRHPFLTLDLTAASHCNAGAHVHDLPLSSRLVQPSCPLPRK